MTAMKKLKIYLDTSVISYLLAEDTPEKMADTHKLWEQIKAGEYNVALSTVTLDELNRCPEPKRQQLIRFIDQINFEMQTITDDSLTLAEKFIDFGILRKKSMDDCQHLAAAILSGSDVVVSWNFKHIVNAKTIKGMRIITTAEGYKDVIICSPTMLIEGEENDED